MGILGDDQRIMRTYSLRSTSGGVSGEVTRMRYHHLLQTPEQVYLHNQLWDNLQLAERHISLGTTEVLGSVSLVISANNDPLNDFGAFTSFNGGLGGRHIDYEGQAAVYPVVMRMRKFPEYGKCSSMFWRGVLRELDINRDAEGRVYLHGDYDDAGLSHAYFNTFAFSGGVLPVIPDTLPGAQFPHAYRMIKNYGGEDAIRLTTVPDAQNRKTHKAQGYQSLANGLLNAIILAGREFRVLISSGADFISGAADHELENRITPFFGAFAALEEYYTIGVELDDADCWRPSSGLNPYSLYARSILQRMKERGDAAILQYQQYQRFSEGELSMEDVTATEEQFSALCGMFMLYLDRERFTGTPRYIPRGLSKCHAGTIPI